MEPMFPHARCIANITWTVERIRGTTAAMARSEYGYPFRILFHPFQCHMFRDLDARSGGTGRQLSFLQGFSGGLCIWVAE